MMKIGWQQRKNYVQKLSLLLKNKKQQCLSIFKKPEKIKRGFLNCWKQPKRIGRNLRFNSTC